VRSRIAVKNVSARMRSRTSGVISSRSTPPISKPQVVSVGDPG
jgi:hypothetical protein